MEQKAVLSCEHVSFCYPRQTDNAIRGYQFFHWRGGVCRALRTVGLRQDNASASLQKESDPIWNGLGQAVYRGSDLETMDDRRARHGSALSDRIRIHSL